jgi:hypothetical protein
MTLQSLPTVPDREALRALYDEAVGQINTSRPAIDLTSGFYAETGNAVFDAGYLALSDHCTEQPARGDYMSSPHQQAAARPHTPMP